MKIIAVSNRKLCERPFLEQIERVCQMKPQAIILREKDLSEEEYRILSEEVLSVCKKYEIPCILHKFWKTALELECTSVHLPLPELRKLPEGVNVIVGALAVAPIARIIVVSVEPGVNILLSRIGLTISAATDQSPIVMGFLLGGIMKMICTSPLSSMALTAMLGLTGLPMGIAAVACFGGSFTNGIIFDRLKLGERSNVIAVMLEPLTQADIITQNPIPIYGSNFFGGGLAGLAAAMLGIINNAPGTASPIPGLLAPFGFNPPLKVVAAIVLAAIGGSLAGFVGSIVFKGFAKTPADIKASEKATETIVPEVAIAAE